MNDVDQQHFNTGWNDTAHGILTWTNHEKWPSALAWALDMKNIALEERPKALGSHNKAYFTGVCECVDEYQRTGTIEKKTPAKAL